MAMPMDEKELLEFLDRHGIGWRRFAHPPLHTVEQSRAVRAELGDLPGAHVKNMFLKDKKGVLVLVTCLEDRRIRLQELERVIGTKRLSFASAERLWTHLGVRPGAVTPLALVNDRDDHAVRLVLDAQMMRMDPIYCHPLDNTATVAIGRDDLERFFALTGHVPQLVDFDALEKATERPLAAQPRVSR